MKGNIMSKEMTVEEKLETLLDSDIVALVRVNHEKIDDEGVNERLVYTVTTRTKNGKDNQLARRIGGIIRFAVDSLIKSM